MIAMKPHPRWPDAFRRARGWLAQTAVLAFVPKCGVCVLAYLGVGSTIFGTRELCGARADPAAPLVGALALVSVLAVPAGFLLRRRMRRRRRWTVRSACGLLHPVRPLTASTSPARRL